MALEKLPKSGPKVETKNFRATRASVEHLAWLAGHLQRPQVGILENLLFLARDSELKGVQWKTPGVPRTTQLSFKFSDAAVSALKELSKRHQLSAPGVIEVLIEYEFRDNQKKKR